MQLPLKNCSTQTVETACDSTVANAAPRTPILKPKIRIGSSTMLVIAPMMTVNILTRENPWAEMNAFMPSVS